MLNMLTEDKENILHVVLEGALDSHTATEFKAWMEESLLDGYRAFLLNFSRLDYISSRGISVLFETADIMQKHEAHLVILEPSEETRNLLDFFGVTKKLKVSFDWESALSDLARFKKVEPPVDSEEEIEIQLPDLEKEQKEPQQEETNEESLETTVDQEIEITSKETHSESTLEPKETRPENTEENEKEEASEDNLPKDESVVTIKQERSQELSHEKKDTSSIQTVEVNIIHCPNCGKKLKVTKPGKYLCPDCRIRFQYPFY
ncbi:MAG: anti-sigma factor antagonist [Candidatus Hydrogenedentota bacterium]|nr:MAG: anti-sigma factor antagonist [Candidatus Hydrogenedentota bacterium]